MEGILAGLRVVELSAFVAAPLGGATLAALGADVIRLDPLGGGIDIGRWPLHEGRSLYWEGLNRGKRSVTLDLRSQRGAGIAARIAGDAGTVLTNLPQRGPLAYERLRERRPDLVMLSIGGRAEAGWSAPCRRRLLTGEGRLVRLSLAEVAVVVAGHLGLLAEAELVQQPRGRFGNHVYGTFGRDFETADRRFLMVLALTPRQWRSLAEATELPFEQILADLSDEGDRWRHRREICDLLAPWVAGRSLADVAAAFERHQVLWGPYRSFKEVLAEEPQAGRGPAAALDFGEAGRALAQPAPGLGADTEAVLAGLGEDVEELRAAGIIG